MTMYGPVLLVVLVAGLLAGYLVLRREMQREIAELRRWVEEAQRARLAEYPPAPVTVATQAPVPKASEAKAEKKKESVVSPRPEPVKPKEEVTPEILAIIAAAVAQFVGAGARIRSARPMQFVPESNAWAQQGRVIVQASHNLGMR